MMYTNGLRLSAVICLNSFEQLRKRREVAWAKVDIRVVKESFWTLKKNNGRSVMGSGRL